MLDVALVGDRSGFGPKPGARVRCANRTAGPRRRGRRPGDRRRRPPTRRRSAGHRDDHLPGLALEHGLAAARPEQGSGAAVAAARGLRRRRRAAEPRLERRCAARRHRCQPGARDVDERAPVAESAEIEPAQRRAVTASSAASTRVERELAGAHEVVRGAAGDDSERHVKPSGELGDPGDRPVAAGDYERSGASAATRSRSASSQPNTLTSAPCARIARTSGSG